METLKKEAGIRGISVRFIVWKNVNSKHPKTSAFEKQTVRLVPESRRLLDAFDLLIGVRRNFVLKKFVGSP